MIHGFMFFAKQTSYGGVLSDCASSKLTLKASGSDARLIRDR